MQDSSIVEDSAFLATETAKIVFIEAADRIVAEVVRLQTHQQKRPNSDESGYEEFRLGLLSATFLLAAGDLWKP